MASDGSLLTLANCKGVGSRAKGLRHGQKTWSEALVATPRLLEAS